MAPTAMTDETFLLLRAELIAYLRWKRAPAVEDLVQETIARLLEKVNAGERILNVHAYATRIAELVFLEELRLRRTETALAQDRSRESDDRPELLSRCLDECRKRCLTRREDSLIRRYYEADTEHRKLLATALNISENELRKRAMHIRRRLKACMDECMRNSGQ